MLRYANLALAIELSILVVGGCVCTETSEPVSSQPLSEKRREALVKEVVIPLPDDVALVATSHGSIHPRRFWTWVFYTKSSFEMVPSSVPSSKDYLPNRDIGVLVDWLQSLLEEENPPRAESASSLDWATDEYDFRGDVVRTDHGEYLIVERIRKRQ